MFKSLPSAWRATSQAMIRFWAPHRGHVNRVLHPCVLHTSHIKCYVNKYTAEDTLQRRHEYADLTSRLNAAVSNFEQVYSQFLEVAAEVDDDVFVQAMDVSGIRKWSDFDKLFQTNSEKAEALLSNYDEDYVVTKICDLHWDHSANVSPLIELIAFSLLSEKHIDEFFSLLTALIQRSVPIEIDTYCKLLKTLQLKCMDPDDVKKLTEFVALLITYGYETEFEHQLNISKSQAVDGDEAGAEKCIGTFHEQFPTNHDKAEALLTNYDSKDTVDTICELEDGEMRCEIIDLITERLMKEGSLDEAIFFVKALMQKNILIHCDSYRRLLQELSKNERKSDMSNFFGFITFIEKNDIRTNSMLTIRSEIIRTLRMASQMGDAILAQFCFNRLSARNSPKELNNVHQMLLEAYLIDFQMTNDFKNREALFHWFDVAVRERLSLNDETVQGVIAYAMKSGSVSEVRRILCRMNGSGERHLEYLQRGLPQNSDSNIVVSVVATDVPNPPEETTKHPPKSSLHTIKVRRNRSKNSENGVRKGGTDHHRRDLEQGVHDSKDGNGTASLLHKIKVRRIKSKSNKK